VFFIPGTEVAACLSSETGCYSAKKLLYTFVSGCILVIIFIADLCL
jgi:hypothetical protein